MWKLDLEDTFFRILDSKKQVAGYFDPDYGPVSQDDVDKMLKNKSAISRGYLTFPMVKFGIFDSDYEASIDTLEQQIIQTLTRITHWKDFLNSFHMNNHFVKISHTDRDMLSVTILISFQNAIPIDKKIILENISDILDSLHKRNLL